jgi:chondroitin 4-sulfotransferase 11
MQRRVMIISDKYKCIFIRVPKTGSTSIEKIWKEFDQNCITSNEDAPPYGHFSCSQLKEMVGEEKWNTYFKFAFIREPKEWFKSQYTYNMLFYHDDNPDLHLLLEDNFKLRDPQDNILNVNDCILFHVILQKWFNSSSMSTYIDLDLDFIGTHENLTEDMKHVFDKVGMKDEIYIPHLNESDSLKYSLDEDSEKFLDITLKKDIELYNKVNAHYVSHKS